MLEANRPSIPFHFAHLFFFLFFFSNKYKWWASRIEIMVLQCACELGAQTKCNLIDTMVTFWILFIFHIHNMFVLNL